MLSVFRNKVSKKLSKFHQFARKDTVFLYQMGKVGSTALECALGDRGAHFHSLYKNINQTMYGGKYLYSNTNILRKLFFSTIDKLFRLILRILLQFRREVKVITLVREPMSRNISFLFQYLPLLVYEYYVEVGEREEAEKEKFYQFLADKLETEFDFYGADNWFDQEIKHYFGVDVYQYPLESSGCVVINHNDRVKILVLKMDSMDDNIDVIRDFVGDPELTLKKSNAGKSKWYGCLYKEFKSWYKPSESKLHKLYSGKFYQHFFADKN